MVRHSRPLLEACLFQALSQAPYSIGNVRESWIQLIDATIGFQGLLDLSGKFQTLPEEIQDIDTVGR